MTKQELNRCLTLRRQLEQSRKLLASLETADLTAEAADVKETMSALEAEIQRSETAVMDWINTIEDIPTHMIFRLRFLRGLEWKTVAALIGGGNTTHSVEVRARRYLEAHHVK